MQVKAIKNTIPIKETKTAVFNTRIFIRYLSVCSSNKY